MKNKKCFIKEKKIILDLLGNKCKNFNIFIND